MNQPWNRLPLIASGCIIIASAIHFFILPHKIIEGGMLGVGLLASYATTIPTGLAIFILSLPIYGIAWYVNKSLIFHNLFGVLIIACLLDILALIPYQPVFPPIVSSWIGGFLIGAGVGLLLVCDITTDALDLFASLCSSKLKINVGILIFFIDLVIISGGTLWLDRNETILSGITVSCIGIITTLVTLNKQRILSAI